MLYLEVSDCNMEEGSLRVDANVSVRAAGASSLGTKTEVKNLNSFRFLQKALAYEIERQIDVIEGGGTITQETRLYDSKEGRTYGMRSKEFAHDYRYFPEPDLLPLVVTEAWQEEARRSLPELPEARKQRFVREYDLSTAEANLFTEYKQIGDYFEKVAKLTSEPKLVANWVITEVQYLVKEMGSKTALPPSQNLAELINLIAEGRISQRMGKDILTEMFASGKTAREIIAAQGLEQINDSEKIAAVAREIIAANPKQVEQYRSGKTATLGWFVGQVMKATRGQANPQLVQDVLKKELGQ
jgi:aspartyl-tRNA(Asn)/glutamyl-tRNA(Gln) amidotransferase subunit B